MFTEEDLECIPSLDGVVHEPHPYTPQDTELELWCGGVSPVMRTSDQIEVRNNGRYRAVLEVSYSGVKALHKMAAFDDIEKAREWVKEFQEESPDSKPFLIWETIETRSYKVE